MSNQEVVNYEVVNIFPTTIYVGEMQNHHQYKRIFYENVYERYSFDRMNSYGEINTVSENCGRPILQTEKDLIPMYREIVIHIQNYLQNTLKSKPIFDVQITKSWMSRSYSSQENIPEHYHSTSQISFVYYMSAPAGANELVFVNSNTPNVPFKSFDDRETEEEAMIRDYTFETTPYYGFPAQEGTVILFPSSLRHFTSASGIEQRGERLGIVGDCILSLKKNQPMIYSQGYIDPSYWRTFES